MVLKSFHCYIAGVIHTRVLGQQPSFTFTGSAIDRRPVQGVTRLSPSDSWTGSNPTLTMNRVSETKKMDMFYFEKVEFLSTK